MKRKNIVVVAVLFSALLLLPMALADVYVPPGPSNSMDAWISPTLIVIDMQDNKPVGWKYSDGDMYDNVEQEVIPKIEKEFPEVAGKLTVEFSTKVAVFGWIPKVAVSPDQVPPPVEVVITWNGIPYVVTLTLPETQVVGWKYPPELHPDQGPDNPPYEFAWPAVSPFKDAYYNIWVGDIDDIRDQLPFKPPARDFPSGYFFWYIFHPNAGDWIAFDCQPGKTKHPPTYDITALFEYSTSQIWFNHIAFDVRFLEVHKTIKPNPILGPVGTQTVVDTINITNVGKVKATEIDILQTFPSSHEVSVNPKFYTAQAKIIGADGKVKVGPSSLTDFGSKWPYEMPAPFDTLLPEEQLIITLDVNVAVTPGWSGTVVFDVVVSAAEIPEWKYPRSMDGLIIWSEGTPTYEELWEGWELWLDAGRWHFSIRKQWPVPIPIIREEPEQIKLKMDLDPVPVDLNGDGKINAQDVAIVRQAVVGLIPYDYAMDINVNGVIDTQDLAAYKLAAG